MIRSIKLFFVLILCAAAVSAAFGQTPPPPAAQTPTGPLLKTNPKITLADYETAKAETLAAGGEQADLIFAARIDAVTRGAYDSLIVVYSKPVKNAKNYFAFILRDAQRFPLVFDKKDKLGRALPTGDKYLRMGLRHEEGKSPLIRLMGSTTVKDKGMQQRNLDFQFNGTEFAMVGESTMPLPK